MLLSTPIALGATAEIYAWKDGWVLKLFHQGISRSTVEFEASVNHTVYASGMRVPAVGQIIETDGRFGLEYERVEGTSMLQELINQPWRFIALSRQLAELQADMHTRQVPQMPSQRDRLAEKIKRASQLSENLRQAALDALEQLPDDEKLCHGDFHPGNILLTDRGPVIIDWMDASRGNPLMDVARSTLLFGGGPLPVDIPRRWLVRILMRWFYRIYLWRYFQLSPYDRRLLSAWIPVAAAARLDENITMDEDRLLSIAKTLINA